MRAILEGRADRALDDEPCDTTAIAKAAALAAQEVGERAAGARSAPRRRGAGRAERQGAGHGRPRRDRAGPSPARSGREGDPRPNRVRTVHSRSYRDPLDEWRGSGAVDGDPASVRAGGGVARRLAAVDAEAHPRPPLGPPLVGVSSTLRAEQGIERGAIRRVRVRSRSGDRLGDADGDSRTH